MFAGPLGSMGDTPSSSIVERSRNRGKRTANPDLPSHVLQTHNTKRTTKTAITAAVGYLCHLPSESTRAKKMKATKNDMRLTRPTSVTQLLPEHEAGLTPRAGGNKEGCTVSPTSPNRNVNRVGPVGTLPEETIELGTQLKRAGRGLTVSSAESWGRIE